MPLSERDYIEAAVSLGCDIAAIKAVDEVESGGSGFLKDGRLRVLFEGHIFHKYTKGAYAQTHPTLCHPKWTPQHYVKGGPERRGDGELCRLEAAKQLDYKAALLSASVGRFQIMGFNYQMCGFESVEEFWTRMSITEWHHLLAFCCFVKSQNLDKALRTHDWATFARRYNGPGYAKNRYDVKLATAWQKHVDAGPQNA
jgi:hypothetical protein